MPALYLMMPANCACGTTRQTVGRGRRIGPHIYACASAKHLIFIRSAQDDPMAACLEMRLI